MAIDGYFPRITPPKKYDNYRMGDGLGLIVTLADGKKVAFLYDGFQGGEPTDALIEWFKDNGITEIEICVISHAHGDHSGGCRYIVENGKLKVKNVLCSHPDSLKHGVNGTSNGQSVADDIDDMYEFIRAIQSKGTKVNFIDHGSVVEVGDMSFKVYRKQPRSFTDEDEGNGWAFVNNGSLVLCSPEIEIVLPGDGPEELEEALDYFNQPIVGMSVSHHGGSCNRPNAKAAKARGCVIAWESCVEKDGVGTSDHTKYGSKRVKEQGIPVWMQNYHMTFHAEKGKITFMQNGKTVTAKVPYQGAEVKIEPGWVKNAKGWWYKEADGSYARGWKKKTWSGEKVHGSWFLFDDKGYMQTGWVYSEWSGGRSWFFLDRKTGAMKTGWLYDGGLWYYLDPATGAMKTGWLKYKEKWCYLEPAAGPGKKQGHCYVNCQATIGGKLYSFDKNGYATEISDKGTFDGCDAASYQYDINPAQMTTTDFFIIKATQGTWYVNPYFEQQYAKAEAAGKLLGTYHYGEGGDPIKEARFYVSKLGKKVGKCIMCIDWEGKSNGKFNTPEEVVWILKFAMEVYRLTGVHIFLYMSKSVTWRRNWSEVAKDVRLWCAQYANSEFTNYLEDPWTDRKGFGAWAKDTIRQYSSHGRVRGYGKNLDINKAYMSRNEWLSAAKGTLVNDPVVAQKPKTQWSAYVSMTTSPVKISNSGSDENGKYKGGKAGDQTGKEWRIRDWYNYPWNCVLRHPLAEVRACLATMAVKAAENDNIGYDQLQRDDYGIELAKNEYDPSKITKPVESDCSKGVIDNTKSTGHTMGIPALQNIKATYTGNMRAAYKAAGFYVLTDKKYLTSSDYLLAGDILLNDAHHTCTVVTNGAKSGDTVVMPLVKKGSTGAAVEQLQEMLIAQGYSCGKWGADGDFGDDTLKAVKSFQRDHGLEVDGEVGPITWAALLEERK